MWLGMASGEAGGEVVAENGAERGAGDTRDCRRFERFGVRAGGFQPRDAVREVEEKLVGETGDPQGSRIGAEEEEGFVEADGFGRGAEPPLGGSGQEFFELPGACLGRSWFSKRPGGPAGSSTTIGSRPLLFRLRESALPVKRLPMASGATESTGRSR